MIIFIGGMFSMKKVFDMFNNELRINDRVYFIIQNVRHDGIINYVSSTGYVKINSLAGEFRRKGNNVWKVTP